MSSSFILSHDGATDTRPVAVLFKNNAGRIGYKTTATEGRTWYVGPKTWVDLTTAKRRMAKIGWTFTVEG